MQAVDFVEKFAALDLQNSQQDAKLAQQGDQLLQQGDEIALLTSQVSYLARDKGLDLAKTLLDNIEAAATGCARRNEDFPAVGDLQPKRWQP